jgi:hypothetical protein
MAHIHHRIQQPVYVNPPQSLAQYLTVIIEP